jgi:hypothetical protein
MAALWVAVCAPVCAQGRNAMICGGERVADFALGKRFSTYAKVLGKPTSTTASRNADDASGIFYKKFGLLFFVKKDMVNGITVSNPLMQTPEGIRVGSSRARVEQAYGSPQTLGEGRSRTVFPERGLGFDYTGDKVAHIYVFDKEARDLASGDRRIVPGVRLGGLALGQSSQFVVSAWKQPDQRSPLPAKAGAELWSYTRHGVVVVVLKGAVDGVWVFSREFRTRDDLGVGSTRQEVTQVYGAPSAVEKGLEIYASRGIGFLYEDGKVREVMLLEAK